MNEYETTINSLEQLAMWMSEGDWDNIQYIEEDCMRYTIAISKAVKVLKEQGKVNIHE